jgi:AhpD family alkylhydroperoxidase
METKDRKEVYAEAVKLLGRVPGFLDVVPDDLIGPRWEEWRILQLEDTKIPPKFKQLIMLAVSTYAKCRYCIEFHAEVAKLFGATDDEIAETACLTGNTALWSNFLQGMRYDFDAFKDEVHDACEHAKRSKVATAQPAVA